MNLAQLKRPARRAVTSRSEPTRNRLGAYPLEGSIFGSLSGNRISKSSGEYGNEQASSPGTTVYTFADTLLWNKRWREENVWEGAAPPEDTRASHLVRAKFEGGL